MSNQQQEKVIILVAPTGYQMPREGGPYVPISPEEIAEDVFRCYQAGASIAHIHARDEKTKLITPDTSVYSEIFRRIRGKCDIVIQITSAIASWFDPVTNKRVRPSEEERMALLDVDPRPDMIPTVMGTIDVSYADGSYATFPNTPDFLRKIIPALIKKKLGWEWEVWDISFLYNGLRLAEEGVFDKNMPFLLHYVMELGGQPAIPRQLVYISEEGQRLFPQAQWEVSARRKNVFATLALGMSLGCHVVRVGFEDNIYLPNGEIAKYNAQLVESVARIAQDLGREIAIVDEAKEILSLPR